MPTNTLLRFFAKSPLKPLQEHATRVYACCRLLLPFFEAVQEGNWKIVHQLRQKIFTKERQADKLKREIRLKLPSGLFLPVDRTDMLELLAHQDRLADKTKDISGVVVGRKLAFPSAIEHSFKAYLVCCLDATSLAHRVIKELDDLLLTGFQGKQAALVENMVTELDRIEDDSDKLQISVRQELKALEDAINPIDVMFMYKIFDWIGDLADQALRVGARIELMLARS